MRPEDYNAQPNLVTDDEANPDTSNDQEADQEKLDLNSNGPEFSKSLAVLQIAIDHALKDPHTKFMYLHSIEEVIALNSWIRTIKKLVKGFKTIVKNSFDQYINLVDMGLTNLDTVLGLNELQACLKYYQDELAIGKDMKNEYFTYVLSGHILHTIIGRDRTEDEEYDHRQTCSQ